MGPGSAAQHFTLRCARDTRLCVPSHVEQFLAAVKPRLLSYDYYPFGTTGDRPSFFTNLALIREQALQNDIPFMLPKLAVPVPKEEHNRLMKCARRGEVTAITAGEDGLLAGDLG